ncbi:methyl-accepting chemotaxis protein [Halarcobacter ebronensis]|uniref:methyl-accepting chemotaxis protein n=1 Tax=Halarcobacter ebronensis TaxID=1462615 RepID=UPI00155DAE3F|nr:methyl-accepting chemotaxis protein [Halarcobacter ebronensis]QKF81904.1 Cache sensor-containing MCP-domain signal transduction protein [Halarcobacter ebronensis]
MKSISFGNKLLIKVLGVTIVVFATTMFFVAKYSYEAAGEDANTYIKEKADKYANRIKGNIDSSISVVKTLVSEFQEAINYNKKLNDEETIAMLTSVLKNNDQILGLWWSTKEPDVLFNIKEDGKQIHKNWYTEKGEFNPYVTRSKSKIIVQLGSEYNEENIWIKGPKEAGKLFITKPYVYKIDGVDTLMLTVAAPLYKNGEYVGVMGAELELKSFVEMTKDADLYESGYFFILDHYGIVLGHPDNSYIGKTILERTNNSKSYVTVIDKMKENKPYSYSKISNSTGLEATYYSKPFNIKSADVNWGVVVTAPVNEYMGNANHIRNFSIIASIIAFIIIGFIIYLSVRQLKINLDKITNGLNSFFDYLNKESDNTNPITLDSDDEFGQMANRINTNIDKIKKSINEDNILIENVKEIVNRVGEGYLDKKISKNSQTDTLNELKNLFNNMLENLEKLVGTNINILSQTLEKYSERDFTVKLDESRSGIIGKELMNLNKMMTEMLQDNQRDGFSLKGSSDELTRSVHTLSKNATEQAASLEETAASIDEITGNIKHTSEKAQEMLNVSSQTKNSAAEGKKLANGTVSAMDEINETVLNINEAISVIDQIAFQTNILSLNAAVEAATAGEAGKGFAVVAQEVRNLASRSAEAAKEIKELVESATQKASNGKNISAKMIEGFSQLEERIEFTNNLIDDVSNAAKEQTIGMTQIADAMNQLDRFTQENAAIADKTNGIAKETNSIALDVVNNVDKNNFDGKNSVKQNTTPAPKKEKVVEKNVVQKPTVKKDTVIKAKKEDEDEWESF